MSSTIWGSQGACPLAEFEAAPHARGARRIPATGGKCHRRPTGGNSTAPSHRGPLSLFTANSSERQRFVKGARFVRGLRTLDKALALRIIQGPGKGGRGLRGLAPWRSLRQRLIRAFRARASRGATQSFLLLRHLHLVSLSLFALLGLLPSGLRAPVAILPSALFCGPWPRCPLVFSMQWGAAISVAAWRMPSALAGPPQPRSHPKLGASHDRCKTIPQN